ncbi:hypothetical protein GCM10007424_10030 [Flavobacterium suaedae]|uniref:EpsG family protein n=2 Tax=Flavobacterium suaedae TaxID=1767027 RepID=A0ABQ1JQE1_9FLAO|nr:hypothetical protein GCM10007424_10030 [Flavobacterium suaedae]
MALLVAVRNFKSSFSKTLLIGVVAFIGMTANSEGDLERYEAIYHINSNLTIGEMWTNLIGLQDGKFYISAFAFLLNLFTDNYHIYFAFLYTIFGYYLVNFVYLFFDEKVIKNTKLYGLLFFISFALFFSIRNSLNLAFYTGVIYYMYFISKSIILKKNKFLLFLLLTPLFHFSLAILLIPTFLYVYLKNKPITCVILVVITLGLNQSSITGIIQQYANSNKGTIIEDKYRSYASEDGMERLEERYRKGELNYNWKLKLLNTTREIIIDFFSKIGVFLIFFYRKKLGLKEEKLNMLSLVLLLWATCNLTVNFSNGDRFLILFSAMAYALFIMMLEDVKKIKLYYIFTLILIPLSLFFGVMSLYASNKFISEYFYFSNFLIELF